MSTSATKTGLRRTLMPKRSARFGRPLGVSTRRKIILLTMPPVVLHSVVGSVVHCGVSAFQMPKGMEDPVSDHCEGVVAFIELPLFSCVCDHPLHDVVLRHEVDKDLSRRPSHVRLDLRHLQDGPHPVVENRQVVRQDRQRGDGPDGPEGKVA